MGHDLSIFLIFKPDQQQLGLLPILCIAEAKRIADAEAEAERQKQAAEQQAAQEAAQQQADQQAAAGQADQQAEQAQEEAPATQVSCGAGCVKQGVVAGSAWGGWYPPIPRSAAITQGLPAGLWMPLLAPVVLAVLLCAVLACRARPR
jgi:multidrug efflux pump subunit AcrA (membrane-fusion protein)